MDSYENGRSYIWYKSRIFCGNIKANESIFAGYRKKLIKLIEE